MYTGKTEQPCCLCADPETTVRLDLPPRAVPEMKHGAPIAWQDIEGTVSVHFCADDWRTVRELVLETGMSPLPRCNAARAAFVLREDFEALTDEDRAEPDHTDLERRLLAESRAVLDGYGNPDTQYTDRDAVEAIVVQSVLEDGADRRQPA